MYCSYTVVGVRVIVAIGIIVVVAFDKRPGGVRWVCWACCSVADSVPRVIVGVLQVDCTSARRRDCGSRASRLVYHCYRKGQRLQ